MTVNYTEQLDLFSQQHGKIIVFPPACRRDLILEICDQLERIRSPQAGDRYWQRMWNSMEGELQSRGLDEKRITELLNDLHEACENEQRRRFVVRMHGS